MEPNDLTQECIERASRAVGRSRWLGNLDPDELIAESLLRLYQRPTAAFDSSDHAIKWLVATSRNVAREQWRRPGRGDTALGTASEDAAISAWKNKQSTSPVVAAVETALRTLDSKTRELLQYCDVNGEDRAEVADELGLHIRAADKRRYTAKKRLRDTLSRFCPSKER